MTFEEWWDSTRPIATPDSFRGWELSCRQAWNAAINHNKPAEGVARDQTRDELRKPSRAVADEVLRERFRQIESEGWTPEHDDEHDDGEIPHAAACYALMAGGTFAVDPLWPKDWGELKAKPQRRMLVVAAALLLAEIERIDRQARPDQENDDDRP